ncbi:hypothetical protein [Neptunomonas antarctica]|uniref:Uncharacterized protein n=1 Tax=Neptunomonas antarctica TaxID=619304 RepID=A0A1N7LQ19_9GAMM|nr:hypothetical protein [Neptunomonas antarctica]SIS75869.1 hypothetical protein SAMN05421760_104230 [Neptunomonas antarctica]
MQIYKLLGTVQTQQKRQVLVSGLIASGWERSVHNEDEDQLSLGRVRLHLEGESTLLLDAGFTGKPEDITCLIETLDKHPVHYSLDLFGDSARLVRRFIK